MSNPYWLDQTEHSNQPPSPDQSCAALEMQNLNVSSCQPGHNTTEAQSALLTGSTRNSASLNTSNRLSGGESVQITDRSLM